MWINAFLPTLFSRSRYQRRLRWHRTVEEKQDLEKMRGFSLSTSVIYARATSRFLFSTKYRTEVVYHLSRIRSELNNQLIRRINDCSISEGTRINRCLLLVAVSRLLYLKIPRPTLSMRHSFPFSSSSVLSARCRRKIIGSCHFG